MARDGSGMSLIEPRYALRTGPSKEGGAWVEITCPRCEMAMQMRRDILDQIIKRWGYTFCPNAFCAVRLHAADPETERDLANRMLKEQGLN